MRRDLQPDDLGDLLTGTYVGILATHFADGTDLLSPVWYEWSNGGFTFVTFSGDIKLRHMMRDPQVSLVVAESEPPYRGMEVRGPAQITDADGLAQLRRLAERYLKQRNVDAYTDRITAWMDEVGHSKVILVRLEPGILRAWDYADEDW
jgi:PPOX class probable F420-dependent enzyme